MGLSRLLLVKYAGYWLYKLTPPRLILAIVAGGCPLSTCLEKTKVQEPVSSPVDTPPELKHPTREQSSLPVFYYYTRNIQSFES